MPSRLCGRWMEKLHRAYDTTAPEREIPVSGAAVFLCGPRGEYANLSEPLPGDGLLRKIAHLLCLQGRGKMVK